MHYWESKFASHKYKVRVTVLSEEEADRVWGFGLWDIDNASEFVKGDIVDGIVEVLK